MKGIFYFTLLTIIFFTIPVTTGASEADHSGGFNTVDYVFDHITDSHEWHFFSVGNKHYSIPLPVILYSKHTGLHVFLSSKFHHPPESFNFYFASEGSNEGKIVEKLNSGDIYKPFDISLKKSVINVFLVALILITFTVRAAKKARVYKGETPKGVHSFVETLIVFVRDNIAKTFIGPKHEKFLPFLTSLFTFILLANFMGLILPLGFNVTYNIAVTMVLALFTLFATLLNSNKKYWKHIFNPDVPIFMKTPVAPIMQLVEIMGVLIKPLILMIRLFANMLAGHMIITVLLALIFLMTQLHGTGPGIASSIFAILFSIFILFLDILVSFIQTYIFTLLSALYIGNAIAEEH
jgi:F-type H+-transporting ATPase subunit a